VVTAVNGARDRVVTIVTTLGGGVMVWWRVGPGRIRAERPTRGRAMSSVRSMDHGPCRDPLLG
jgi:hypothetical protein